MQRNWPVLTLLLLVLVLSLTGCASPSKPLPPVVVECPKPAPLPPELVTLAPPPNYSQIAQERIKNWRLRLTGSPSN